MPVSAAIRPRSVFVCSLVLSLLAGASSASGDLVQPPGPTGCAGGLTQSNADPQAQLPPTAVFRSGQVRVRMVVANATQTTKVTLRAYLPGGRRADAFRGYSCTVQAARNLIAFPVKPGTVGAAIRRHGTVKLRVRFQMVNANGRRTTLLRVITVRRERAAEPHFVG